MSSSALVWEACDVSRSSAVPPARTYFSLVSYQSKLFLFGGYGDTKSRFNDVFEYSSAGRAGGWKLVQTSGESPKPVYLHSSSVWGSQMVVFGGNNAKECSDLFYLDLETSQWTRSVPAGGFMGMGGGAKDSLPPAARYGHASTVYAQNQLLIVGGCKSNNLYFKDSWSLDLHSKKWRKLEDLPLDLAYHSLFTWQDQAYLFGGYNGKSYVQHMYLLDGQTGKWQALQVSGQAPPPICGAATVVKGNELYVFGGYTDKGHTNELYRFNLSTRVWTLLPTSNKPLARAYLHAQCIGDRISVFGGFDGSHCVSDFRCLTLPSANGASAASASGDFSGFGVQNPFMQADFWNKDRAAAADQLIHIFGGGSNTLARHQIAALVDNLQTAWRARSSSAASSASVAASSSAASAASGNYPFNTSQVDAITQLGFPRDHVLAVMAKMHAAGQSTTRVELVADMCLREPPQEAPDSRALERQNSERTKLQAKVTALQEAQQEERQCKICMASQINTALMDCGHLAVCQGCADALKAKSSPCPICQQKIRAYLKVFWT